jgi:high-affinity nickel permease
MKNLNKAARRSSTQSGFFDLGISLLILVMAGSAVYVTERNTDEKMASLQEIPITMETEIGDKKMSRLDYDIPGC